MFTGIVQTTAAVVTRENTSAGARLVLDAQHWGHRPAPGSSICVSGCCLTALEPGTASEFGEAPQEPGLFAFDAITQTLNVTKLGALKVGDRVNLEHACRADTLLDGHIVQGHVDGVGTVAEIQDNEDDWRLTITPPADLMPTMAPKGSVTLDGVSLTLADVDPAAGTITVALIPTTLDITTLGALKVGDPVNIEADIIAKAVQHQLQVHGVVPSGVGG